MIVHQKTENFILVWIELAGGLDYLRLFLQPIKGSDRHGVRISRVFLKAKVIQASSQLNPDRDKIFQFSGKSSLNHQNPYLSNPFVAKNRILYFRARLIRINF